MVSPRRSSMARQWLYAAASWYRKASCSRCIRGDPAASMDCGKQVGRKKKSLSFISLRLSPAVSGIRTAVANACPVQGPQRLVPTLVVVGRRRATPCAIPPLLGGVQGCLDARAPRHEIGRGPFRGRRAGSPLSLPFAGVYVALGADRTPPHHAPQTERHNLCQDPWLHREALFTTSRPRTTGV